MNEITISSILQKIRTICKESKLSVIPQRNSASVQPNLEQYHKALEAIRKEFLKTKNLQEEYNKLETLLQKQETQIRKRIGVQQQFKLYTETLKSQVEELQSQKLQLLENTKAYIKQLKKTNESLYSQLQYRTNQKGKSRIKSVSSSAMKTDKSKSRHNKSTSNHKPTHDKSIKEIVKTQYIERERCHSGNRKGKKKVKFGVYSTISGHELDYKDNSKTFNVINKKEKNTASKKKNKHGFSNFTLLNMLQSNSKKVKSKDKFATKSPGKLSKRRQGGMSGGKNGKVANRQKKVNRSIFSVMSNDPHFSSKKETI